VGIKRGTLPGGPLLPLLFDLMIAPLIRWLKASQKGYNIASCGLHLDNKWYADDGTLVTSSVEDMMVLLNLVNQFSSLYGIHFNVDTCKITTYSKDLQTSLRKRGMYDALRARLAHVKLAGRSIGSLTQDEPLPRGCLGTALTASLCKDAHLHWTKSQLILIGKALARTPLSPHIK